MEQLLSMSKIFSEKIFRIPDYQRGYAWTLKEVEDFWEDLCRLENKRNHYVGVLTLEAVKSEIYKNWIDDLWIIDSKRYVPFYIVDGQQRLTTSIILIYVICKVMQEKGIERLNYTTRDEILRKFIFEYRDKNDNRTYMYSYEQNNPSYAYLISKIYEEKVVMASSESETIYTSNLSEAKKFFYEKLIDLDVIELEEVYTKITQHFLFNMYTISDDIDVYVTFETMNNRGKALSNLELLKNRLIYLSTLFVVEECEKNRLRRDVNECWKKMYHVLGKNKENVLLDDEFLFTHFMIYFAENIDERRQRKFITYEQSRNWQSDYLLNKYFVPQNISNKKLTIEMCFKYIRSLNDCIDLWADIKNPLSSKYSSEVKDYIDKVNILVIKGRFYRNYKIRYYINIPYFNVFLLSCLKSCETEEIMLSFLKLLEKYLFYIEFYQVGIIEENSINLLDYIDTVNKLKTEEWKIQNVIEKLKKINETILNSVDLNKNAIVYYSKNGFYETTWIQYFLCEYEYSLMKKSKTNICKLNRWEINEKSGNTIEHIYPQNSHNGYWTCLFKQYTPGERKSLKNSLGNLVVISSAKNGKLGNKSFPEKKCNTQNSVGYKFGTYAEIEISIYEDWDANAILERGLKLIAFLSERWGITIGNGKKPDKYSFLGLNFLSGKTKGQISGTKLEMKSPYSFLTLQ